MSEKTTINEASINVASSEDNEALHLKLNLADPFIFDDKEIKEIDLEGLFNLTAADMCAIDMQMLAMGYTGQRIEITRQYALLVAARVNKKPWEFCNRMKARDSIRLRDMVIAFFYARG